MRNAVLSDYAEFLISGTEDSSVGFAKKEFGFV